MNRRYNYDLEMRLNELAARRHQLEQQHAIRSMTLSELQQVRRESANRLCESVREQNNKALQRNQAIREELANISYENVSKIKQYHGDTCTDPISQLQAAKQQYFRHLDTVLPVWHRYQAIQMQEKIKAIQTEKEISVKRREQLKYELMRENEVKQELERNRQELLLSLAIEQRNVLEANANAVLLEEESRAADARMVQHIATATEDMKDLVSSNIYRMREQVQNLHLDPILQSDIPSHLRPSTAMMMENVGQQEQQGQQRSSAMTAQRIATMQLLIQQRQLEQMQKEQEQKLLSSNGNIGQADSDMASSSTTAAAAAAPTAATALTSSSTSDARIGGGATGTPQLVQGNSRIIRKNSGEGFYYPSSASAAEQGGASVAKPFDELMNPAASAYATTPTGLGRSRSSSQSSTGGLGMGGGGIGLGLGTSSQPNSPQSQSQSQQSAVAGSAPRTFFPPTSDATLREGDGGGSGSRNGSGNSISNTSTVSTGGGGGSVTGSAAKQRLALINSTSSLVGSVESLGGGSGLVDGGGGGGSTDLLRTGLVSTSGNLNSSAASTSSSMATVLSTSRNNQAQGEEAQIATTATSSMSVGASVGVVGVGVRSPSQIPAAVVTSPDGTVPTSSRVDTAGATSSMGVLGAGGSSSASGKSRGGYIDTQISDITSDAFTTAAVVAPSQHQQQHLSMISEQSSLHGDTTAHSYHPHENASHLSSPVRSSQNNASGVSSSPNTTTGSVQSGANNNNNINRSRSIEILEAVSVKQCGLLLEQLSNAILLHTSSPRSTSSTGSSNGNHNSTTVSMYQSLSTTASPLEAPPSDANGAASAQSATNILSSYVSICGLTGNTMDLGGSYDFLPPSSPQQLEKSRIEEGIKGINLPNESPYALARALLAIVRGKSEYLIPLDAFSGVVSMDKLKKEYKKAGPPGILKLWELITRHLSQLVELNHSHLNPLTESFTTALTAHAPEHERERLNRKVSNMLQLALLSDSTKGGQQRSPSPPYRGGGGGGGGGGISTPAVARGFSPASSNNNAVANNNSVVRDYNRLNPSVSFLQDSSDNDEDNGHRETRQQEEEKETAAAGASEKSHSVGFGSDSGYSSNNTPVHRNHPLSTTVKYTKTSNNENNNNNNNNNNNSLRPSAATNMSTGSINMLNTPTSANNSRSHQQQNRSFKSSSYARYTGTAEFEDDEIEDDEIIEAPPPLKDLDAVATSTVGGAAAAEGGEQYSRRAETTSTSTSTGMMNTSALSAISEGVNSSSGYSGDTIDTYGERAARFHTTATGSRSRHNNDTTTSGMNAGQDDEEEFDF